MGGVEPQRRLLARREPRGGQREALPIRASFRKFRAVQLPAMTDLGALRPTCPCSVLGYQQNDYQKTELR